MITSTSITVRAVCFAMLLIAALLPVPAIAGNVEITPFAGYTMGGTFTDAVTGKSLEADDTSSYGIMVDIRQVEESWIELYYSRQQTKFRVNDGMFLGSPLLDMNIEYYHLGGTYGQATGKVRPFVLGTFGATHMVPQKEGLHSETKFSLSFGGGVRLALTERVGLRLDARWFGTLFNGSGSAFCTNGVCAINVQGDLFSQFVANAGVILAF